ncbi:CHAD domain protein [compost metagenome]
MLKVHSLSHLLRQQWDSFEKQLQRTQESMSFKNVHALRVSTRRLEAILVLTNVLVSTPKSQKILSAIKKVRKGLGPLRDIQVEEMALKELHFEESDRKKRETFRSFLLRNKSDAKKKARQTLKQISLKKRRKSLYQIEKKFYDLESNSKRAQIEKRLDKKVRSSVLKLNRAISLKAPVRVEQIHSIRILTKECRYQCECMKSLTGNSIVGLSEQRQLQTVTGKIQNEKVLIRTLDRFLDKKKNHDNLQVWALREKVRQFQAKLLKPKGLR